MTFRKLWIEYEVLISNTKERLSEQMHVIHALQRPESTNNWTRGEAAKIVELSYYGETSLLYSFFILVLTSHFFPSFNRHNKAISYILYVSQFIR